jgi:putative holliday junction resolvase
MFPPRFLGTLGIAIYITKPNQPLYHIIKTMSIDSQNSAEISHILGIDFGRAKVGLAMADSETKMAFGIKILENNQNLILELGKIIDENRVNRVVIGVPEYENGKTVENEARKLGEELREKFKVVVVYSSEMFTTKMAQANLIEKGIKGVNKLDDQEAARIILQDWLDNDLN